MLNRFLGALITALMYLVHILPNSVKEGIGRLIGLIWFDVLRIRRRTAIDNVLKVFPDFTRKQATQMARQSLIHMGYTIVEFFSFPFFDQKQIDAMFEYQEDGKQKIESALKQEKGIFMLSSHVANGDLAVAALCYSGFPVHLVSKVFKSKWLNDFWFNARAKHGAQFISPKRSSYDILKALKNNQVVIFVLDQYTGPPNGIVTHFFGIKTGTAFGPALLAQRSRAIVLPAYAYRKKFGQHIIVVGDPIEFADQGEKNKTLVYNTEKYNRAIEQMILAHPEQWMWIHRRWKQAW